MTKDEYVDTRMKEFRTRCCNAPVSSRGRAYYVCSHCYTDVTLEVVLLAAMFSEVYNLKYNKDEREDSQRDIKTEGTN